MECSSSGCSPAPDDSCRGCAGSLGALSSFKQVAGRLRCSFRSNGKTLTYAYDRQQIPAVSRHPFSRWLGQDLPWRRLSTQHHPSPAGRRFSGRPVAPRTWDFRRGPAKPLPSTSVWSSLAQRIYQEVSQRRLGSRFHLAQTMYLWSPLAQCRYQCFPPWSPWLS